MDAQEVARPELVSQELERRLQDELLRNQARFAFSGAAVYPILFILVYLSTSISFSYLALAGFLAVLPAAVIRVVAAQRALAAEHPSAQAYQSLFRWSVMASVLGWCIFSGTTIELEGADNWNSMFLLLISTGLASGGASSLVADKKLSQGYIFCLWLTHAAIFLSKDDLPTTVAVTLYCAYLTVQVSRQNRNLVDSLVDRERLRSRTEELESVNRAAKQAQETIKQALVLAQEERRTAEKASRAKSRFLATISHEIRTPLHGVLGMNTLLLDSELEAEQREYAESIRTSGETLLSLINEVLDFSKLEAGRELERLENFQPTELLTQAAGIVQALARERHLSFVLSVDASLSQSVRGDAQHLRQIVLNLLTNAIKFTDTGGVRLDAKLLAERTDRVWVEIRVSDTGIGMSDEEQVTLFEPFKQGNSTSTRVRGGTGLGLAIAKRLTELMGGTLCVESELGAGSTFILHLPFTWASESTVEESPNTMVRLRPNLNVDKSILVVEDNPTNQKILERLLFKAGYQCDVVVNGREAVDSVLNNTYDLVLMDCHMPEMDGYDAAQLIVEKMGDEAPPIVAVTANASDEDRLRCRDCGMIDFIAKPVRLPLLQKVLDTHLSSVTDSELSPSEGSGDV